MEAGVFHIEERGGNGLLGELFWSLFGGAGTLGRVVKEGAGRRSMRTRDAQRSELKDNFMPRNTNPDMEMALHEKVIRASWDKNLYSEIYSRLKAYKERGGEYSLMYPERWERVGNAHFDLSAKAKIMIPGSYLTNCRSLVTRLLMHTYGLRTVSEARAWMLAREGGRTDDFYVEDNHNSSDPHWLYGLVMGGWSSNHHWNGTEFPIYDFMLGRNLTDEEYQDLIRLYEPEYGRYLTEEERQVRIGSFGSGGK